MERLSEVWSKGRPMGNGWEEGKQRQATEKQEGKGGERKEAPVGLLGLAGPVVLGFGSGIRYI